MSLIFDLAWRHALWPVVFWTGAFGLASLVAALVTWQVLRRMGRTRVIRPSIKPLWYAWVVLALVVVPSISTLIFAAPFALERELAILVRTQPPLVVDWAAAYGSRSLRAAVGVESDDVLMDVTWVQKQLSMVDQTTSGTASVAWRTVPRFVQAPYVRTAHRALTSFGTDSPQITWRQLDERVRAILAGSTDVIAEAMSLTLYAGALRYLLFWWLTLAAAHLSTLGARLLVN